MNTSFNDLFSISNQYVLITGAAGLLGSKHAEAVAMSGGIPILTDVNEEKLDILKAKILEKYQAKSLTFKMDISSETDVIHVFEKLKKIGVFVSILINNAARNPVVNATGMSNTSRLENLDFNEWEKDISIGLNGAVICSKIFGTEMAKKYSGNIINISSDLGVIAPDQRLYMKDGITPENQDVKPLSYSVIKHGIIGLTKYLSTYWADKNVRSNSLSPGGIYNGQNEVFLSKIGERIPLGRMADKDEYMGAIIFLCSKASSYMNGANIIIDGGRSIW